LKKEHKNGETKKTSGAASTAHVDEVQKDPVADTGVDTTKATADPNPDAFASNSNLDDIKVKMEVTVKWKWKPMTREPKKLQW
jgi:hypothetical protein